MKRKRQKLEDQILHYVDELQGFEWILNSHINGHITEHYWSGQLD